MGVQKKSLYFHLEIKISAFFSSSGENHSVYSPVLKNLQHYLFFQSPRVKSGISTGTLPCRTERSLSSVMQDHSAASYTS